MKKLPILLALTVSGAIFWFLLPEHTNKPEIPESDPVVASNTNERIGYFASHGWDVDEIAMKEIIIPEKFSEAYEDFACLQDKQGLPLREYAGRDAQLYVYEVKNYSPESRKMLAELLVCDDTAIASMVYSEDSGGLRLAVS